jgi:serine/threonine protein kinase/tetratricopeptide (TPR) repeat protein
MNDVPDEWANELQLWRALSPDGEPHNPGNGCNPSPAASPSDHRAAVVSQCLNLLNEIWPADVDGADDDSVNQTSDITPGPGSWFDGETIPESDLAAEQTKQSKRFGRFRIDRQLGRGGHGFVFRAIDPVLERPVALKIPNPDSLASSELRRRFVEESRALARLEHPNLLPILEAGTVGPVCYLVTPFCAGPSLAEWLHRQDKPVACELAASVVRDLARTVAYVHSRGILHRDIKPSNVLLDPVEHAPDLCAGLPTPHSLCAGLPTPHNWTARSGDPRKTDPRKTDPRRPELFDFVPKLADFGLAKLVSNPATRTTTGAILGTPAYMAPEQAEGRHSEVGVATDVYALGAMLYELLTGRPPYRGDSIVQTLRLISEGRLTPPRSLRSDLPADLNAICLKCLELEPGRRYRSADDLADDLTAFLECRPVQARACGPIARLAKWGRRRPLVASLTASLVLLAFVGFTVIGWQWRRAEAHRQQAEETFSIAHGAIKHLHDVLFEDNEDTYDTPEYYALQKTVLDAAMTYYQQLIQIKSSDPQLRVDFADVFMRLGHMAAAQGSQGQALEWFEKSAEVWQRLVEEDPTNREYRYFLGKLQGRIGGVLRKQNDSTAGQRLQQAVAIQEQLIRESPAFRRARWELSEVLHSLVGLHLDRDEIDQATRLADRAVEVLVEIPLEDRKARPMIQRILAEAYTTSAEAELAAGKLDESVRRCREAVELSRRLVAQNEEMPSSASSLAQSLDLMARLSAQSGDSEGAIKHCAAAIDVSKSLVAKYPEIPKYSRNLTNQYAELAALYRGQARFNDAVQLQHEAIRFFEQQDGDFPNVAELQSGLAEAYFGLALARRLMDDLPGAVHDGEKAVSFYRQVVKQHDEAPAATSKLAYSLNFLAGVQGMLRNSDQAAQLYREAIDLRKGLATKHPDQPRYRRDLADYYISFATQQREQKNYAQAVELYQEARELLEDLTNESAGAAEYQRRLIRCNYLMAYAFELLGRLDDATAALNRGRDIVLDLTPEAKLELAQSKYQIAAAFQMAVHVRKAAGDPEGGIENEWHRELLQSVSR